jgi:hypothetical protein
MAERKIDWDSAPNPLPERTGGFTVVAPLRGDREEGWAYELRLLLRDRADEHRGRWGAVHVVKDKIRVAGVAAGSAGALKEFLNDVVDRANELSAERQREFQEQAAEARSRDEAQMTQSEEMGRELREG